MLISVFSFPGWVFVERVPSDWLAPVPGPERRSDQFGTVVIEFREEQRLLFMRAESQFAGPGSGADLEAERSHQLQNDRRI